MKNKVKTKVEPLVSPLEVVRIEQLPLKHDAKISEFCHLSKNLWNEANFIVKQEFLKTGKWIRFYELDKILNKTSENYKLLDSQSSQQTLQLLDRSWGSAFASMKEAKINPDKFKGKIRFPKYKQKEGETILFFTNQQAKLRNGDLCFTKKFPLKIKTRLHHNTNIREVRFIPKGTDYVCEIVYKTLSEEGVISKRWYAKQNSKNRVLGIDLGTRNVITIANNIGNITIVIKGGILKSINQFYNKQKAKLQSIYDKQGIKKGLSMSKLIEKRNTKIKVQLHKLSKFVKRICVKLNIETIVIGYNSRWKQECDLGKKNNQTFVAIPHWKLINMLSYKLNENGCKVIVQPESYTSKCSFLDNETIEKHEVYLGKRISRGLFRSSNGTIINADVNGALNIIRKAIPNAFAKGIEGVMLHPIRINYLKPSSYNL